MGQPIWQPDRAARKPGLRRGRPERERPEASRRAPGGTSDRRGAQASSGDFSARAGPTLGRRASLRLNHAKPPSRPRSTPSAAQRWASAELRPSSAIESRSRRAITRPRGSITETGSPAWPRQTGVDLGGRMRTRTEGTRRTVRAGLGVPRLGNATDSWPGERAPEFVGARRRRALEFAGTEADRQHLQADFAAPAGQAEPLEQRTRSIPLAPLASCGERFENGGCPSRGWPVGGARTGDSKPTADSTVRPGMFV